MTTHFFSLARSGKSETKVPTSQTSAAVECEGYIQIQPSHSTAAEESLSRRFSQDGFIVLEGLFEESAIDSLREQSLANYEELQELLTSRNLVLGIGIKHGFKEIVQRHLHRFEMPYKMDAEEFSSAVLGCDRLMSVVRAILGDFIIANKSIVLSLPGAEDQAWHVDGGHLSMTEDLPCHCLNVFIPLVDVEHSDGPTELRPGSQFLTRDLKKQFLAAFMTKKLRKTEAPCLKRGGALLFDYRVLHRGLANTSSRPRPVLVYTFCKPYFKDVLNFPSYSVFDPHEGGQKEEEGQSPPPAPTHQEAPAPPPPLS